MKNAVLSSQGDKSRDGGGGKKTGTVCSVASRRNLEKEKLVLVQHLYQ